MSQQQPQQFQQTFEQFLPQQVSQAMFTLEQLESDAEWAHGQAMGTLLITEQRPTR